MTPALKIPLIGAALSTSLLGAGTAWEASRVGLRRGYRPVQPIAFSHRKHAGEFHVPCLYCHHGATRSRHAGIPAASVCMNCHGLLERQTLELRKLREALELGRPIAWIRVHALPDFVAFDHSRHVGAGVACQSCHGAVEQMDELRQVAALTMGWCLECHRRTNAGAAEPRAAHHAARSNLDCGQCHH